MRTRAHHVERFLLTDCARILGVHRNTVRRWIQAGLLEPTPDGLARFIWRYTTWRGRLP